MEIINETTLKRAKKQLSKSFHVEVMQKVNRVFDHIRDRSALRAFNNIIHVFIETEKVSKRNVHK